MKKNKGKELLKRIRSTYEGESIYSPDGLEDSVIGIEEKSMRLVCSRRIALEIIESDMSGVVLDEDEIADGMSLEDKKRQMAIEHFDFNVAGSCFSENGEEKTPVWCDDDFAE
jgi:hypothetical protein